MSSQNPLIKYLPGQDPGLSLDSLVVDQVYGAIGVVDTISNKSTINYYDPSSNQISPATPLELLTSHKDTIWTTPTVLDDVNVTSYELDFAFNQDTYLNRVSFDISAVPCTWQLYQGTLDTGTLIGQGTIVDNSLGHFIHSAATFDSTLLFNSDTPLTLVINKTTTGTQYSVQIKNFLAKLDVRSKTDFNYNGTLISGVGTTNRLGFAEKYVPSGYSVNNIIDSSSSSFWKCSPQPVGDSIVYLVVDIGSLQSFNRIYLDPLYSGNPFNLYFSYDSSTWFPVQRDFRLHKGIYELPTINARYLKFEFTRLTPEPYQLPFNSIERTISVFPNWVDEYFTNIERSIPDIANQSYSQSAAVTPNVFYNTQINTNTLKGTANGNLQTGWGSSNGSQVINSLGTTSITDPTYSYKTLDQSGPHGSVYSPVTNVEFLARRFPYVATHDYKTLTINQTWHLSYFVGLKDLKIYSTNYSEQIDYPEFTDYLLTSGSNSIVYSGTNATFQNMSLVTLSTPNGNFVSTSGGGYVGTAGQRLYTKNLKTVTQYNSFKIAMLSSDWVPFLTSNQTALLSGTSLSSYGITSNNNSGVVQAGGANYGIIQITPSGSLTNYIQTADGGSNNLMTSAEASMTPTTGWTTTTSGSYTTYSGVTPVTLVDNTVKQWGFAYGYPDFGGGAYGTTSALGASVNNSYTFMVTVTTTGSSTAQPIIRYSTSTGSGILTSSGSVVTVTGGSTTILYTTTQPTGATKVDFFIVTSGSPTLSQAGYFVGTSPIWTAPLVFSGMRISAVARIQLPNTNYGTYRCTLLGTKSDGTVDELAYRQVNNLPTKTWADLEVPFTLTNSTYLKFSARLTQTNGQGEVYRVALFGLFYNPIALEYCSDGTASGDPSSTGNWNWITAGINDPNALIALRSSSNQLQLRATFLQDNTRISALSVVPNYSQNPLYSTTPVQYIGDTKSNELSWRRAPSQRPLFQLSHELYPLSYDIANMMGNSVQYYID